MNDTNIKLFGQLDTFDKVFMTLAFPFLGLALLNNRLSEAFKIVIVLYSCQFGFNKIILPFYREFVLPILRLRVRLLEWRVEMNISKNKESPPKEKTPVKTDAKKITKPEELLL